MNRCAIILLLSALFFMGATAQFDVDNLTGHCYLLEISTPKNFSSAAADALTRIAPETGAQGYLATITTAQEQAFLSSFIPSLTTAYYFGGFANALGVYEWRDGPESGLEIGNATACLQSFCAFAPSVVYAPGQALTFFNNTWTSTAESLLEAYIIEFDSCNLTSPSSSPSASASVGATTTTTTTTTGGRPSVTPSAFRPTLTIGTLSTTSTTGSRTTGRRATTGSTTGRRTTGVISAANTMSFSAFSVAIAAVTMMFLRR